MTREEIISNLLYMKRYVKEDTVADITINEAIKALEQEPCIDAISRQAALEEFRLSENTRKYGGDHSGYNTMMLYEIQDILEDLPLVTPIPKMGHWIGDKCSACGEERAWYGCNPTYCPDCGTKMVEKTAHHCRKVTET